MLTADEISIDGSLRVLAELVELAGATIVAKAAVLTESGIMDFEDNNFLEGLLFLKN